MPKASPEQESSDSEAPAIPDGEAMNVKIVNKDKITKSIYDTVEDPEYDEFVMSKKDIEEFENGDT